MSITQYPRVVKLSRFAWDCPSFKTENPAVNKFLSPRKPFRLGQTPPSWVNQDSRHTRCHCEF